MEWTVQDGEVRKPVTGGARTGEPDMHSGGDGERSETDGAVGRVVWSPASPLYVTEPVWLGGMSEKEERKSMRSSEELIKQMFEENLGRAADPDVSVADSGLSSLQAVAFMKAVGEAYNVALPPEEVGKFRTLRDFINYIDSHTS